MSIELIVIGNEVLAGFTINTNAAFIGKKCLEKGLSISRQTVIPDDLEIIKTTFQEALNRSDIVLCSGGLGPTGDDVTKIAAAELFNTPLEYNEALANELKERYGEHLLTIEAQATVPKGVKLMPNPLGTAPGFIFDRLFLLPGVPGEMKEMLTTHVLPQLPKGTLKIRSLHAFDLIEADVNPFFQELEKKYPEVGFGIYPSLGLLHFRLSGDSDQAIKEIEGKYGPHLYPGKIEEAVQHLMIKKKLTLSTAESCTGGHIAAALTNIPGASEYFLGSIVSYANEVKVNVLNVSEKTLEEKGAVSEEVVAQMAEGVLNLTGSDFSLAVSGIAGPTGGTPEKPVGTIWCALGQKGKAPATWRLDLKGNREMNITWSVNALLSALYKQLEKG